MDLLAKNSCMSGSTEHLNVDRSALISDSSGTVSRIFLSESISFSGINITLKFLEDTNPPNWLLATCKLICSNQRFGCLIVFNRQRGLLDDSVAINIAGL